MTRRLAAALLLAAMAAPASAAWPSGDDTGASCALACGHEEGADCCAAESGGRPSLRRCAREETPLAPSSLPPALPVALAGSTVPHPSRRIEGPPADVPASAFSPAIDHIPLLLS